MNACHALLFFLRNKNVITSLTDINQIIVQKTSANDDIDDNLATKMMLNDSLTIFCNTDKSTTLRILLNGLRAALQPYIDCCSDCAGWSCPATNSTRKELYIDITEFIKKAL